MDSKKNETPLHEMETLVCPDGEEFLPEPSEARDDPDDWTRVAEDGEEDEKSGLNEAFTRRQTIPRRNLS